MSKQHFDIENYLGLTIENYKLEKEIGHGKIGCVFKAVKYNPTDILACKIIPEGKLKDGWQREISKVLKLRNIDNIVQYHSHGTTLDNRNRPITYIMWNYVDGENLETYVKENQFDLSFIEDLANTLLNVLYSCDHEKIEHGDLHPGNILIGNPDPRVYDSKPKIWVSDFGYGGSHNDKEPKEDYKMVFSIITSLLHSLDPAILNPLDRILFQKMEAFFSKRFLEINPMQGAFVGNLGALIKELRQIRYDAENEMAKTSKAEQVFEPGDYLSAETLGFRIEEWRNLFVPEFLAAQDLLSKNITILTGARGCGKTMAFRRLTCYMDKIIGEGSGVIGAEQFNGFYVNCRDLIEAFPWIPTNINSSLQAQIVHYFHLTWLSEICKTLSVYDTKRPEEYIWLENLIISLYGNSYKVLPKGANILSHILSFIENEKERCRQTDFSRKKEGLKKWPLARTDFLDILHAGISSNISWAQQKPFYLFLDDYTIPIIPRNVQRLLNPIIFKRRSDLFFKVSTESAISFERVGVNGKPLELHHDFELIDLATESLYQDAEAKTELIEKIFKPRLERHELLKDNNLFLKDVLGKMRYSSNELAWNIRNAAQGKKKRFYYSGLQAFVGLWASDIRIMIQIFVDMLRESSSNFKNGDFLIDEKIQDKVYKAAGGEFLAYAASVPNPSFLEKRQSVQKNTSFGNHLKDIVEAFINVSKYELSQGELVSNKPHFNPRQAFRLEIIDKFKLDQSVQDYYDGLVRWHIFLQDWRGKSVRGMITPRLFLNRVLLPHSQLTFSTHDNIHITSAELVKLLNEPRSFLEYWKKKKKSKPNSPQLF